MYAARRDGADSGTIDPAALNSPGSSSPQLRVGKHVASGAPVPEQRYSASPKRNLAKPISSGNATLGGPSGHHRPSTMSQLPPHHTQGQDHTIPPQATQTYVPPPAPAAPAPKPAAKTVKALPTVRDHTTDQLNEAHDEYIPREIDEFGEKKVMANGTLLGNRQYRCRTFLVPNRGDKLFMLATECARVLGYRDSYLLFNKNRSLFKIIATQQEKDDLVQQEILPFSYRSRQIAIVTARSMFRQFGSRVIEGGRRVRDDYWEQKARKQGFTELDAAGEKRPGAAKAREQAEAAQNNAMLSGAHTEIVYNNNPAAFPAGPPQPPILQPELMDTRPRDYSGIVKGGPRQEITGPPYQDQTRPTSLSEIGSQATHANDFSRSINQARDMRTDYLQGSWRRTHEQPSSGLAQGVASDTTVPTSRPTTSPHATASSITQPPIASQSPQMMMTNPPYTQSLHAHNQPPMRSGSTGSVGQGAPNYSYQPGQAMWSNPQQQGYGSYTTQPQHASQSPAPQLRQPSGQMQQGMQFPGMGGMQYGAGNIYPADQTPRGYMPQGSPTQPQQWSGQQHSQQQQQQWWQQNQQQHPQ